MRTWADVLNTCDTNELIKAYDWGKQPVHSIKWLTIQWTDGRLMRFNNPEAAIMCVNRNIRQPLTIAWD